MNELIAWHIAYLGENPGHGPIKAISAGMQACGRGFGSPGIAEHRAAFEAAKAQLAEKE